MSPTFFQINIVEIGIFVLGLGYIWTKWKEGGNKASSEVLSTYQTQVNQLKEKGERNAEQINKLTSDLGELKGILKEKEERIRTLEAVDLDRNPQMKEFITAMTKTIISLEKYMNNSDAMLLQIRDALITARKSSVVS